MTRSAWAAAIVCVVLWQLGATANSALVVDSGYRSVWAQRYVADGVNLSADGPQSKTLTVSTFEPDTDQCDRPLDVIATDPKFVAEISSLWFTIVECIARDGSLQIVSSEKREITPRMPRLPWRKRAEA
jgi:hypothetical protein